MRDLFDRFGLGDLPQNEKRMRLAAVVHGSPGLLVAARLLRRSSPRRVAAASAPANRDRRPSADADAVAVGERDVGVRGDRGRIVVQRVPFVEPGRAPRTRRRPRRSSTACRREMPGSPGAPARSISGRCSPGLAAAAADPVLALGEREAPLGVVGRKRHAGDREAVELGAVGGDDRLPRGRRRAAGRGSRGRSPRSSGRRPSAARRTRGTARAARRARCRAPRRAGRIRVAPATSRRRRRDRRAALVAVVGRSADS